MKTTLINIYGAPGSGKSVLAAELYVDLSKKSKKVELIREVVKSWAWRGTKPIVYDQIYITTEQMRDEAILYGKVEYLITDSPVLLGEFYTNYYHGSAATDGLAGIVKQESKELLNPPINIFLNINEAIFKEQGRYSNLHESKAIEVKLKKFLDYRVKFDHIDKLKEL